MSYKDKFSEKKLQQLLNKKIKIYFHVILVTYMNNDL